MSSSFFFHFQAFHDNTPKEPKVVEVAEEEDDDLPTFSEDMDEARQQIQKVMTESVVESDSAPEPVAEPVEPVVPEESYQNVAEEVQEAAYDPNAYPGKVFFQCYQKRKKELARPGGRTLVTRFIANNFPRCAMRGEVVAR